MTKKPTAAEQLDTALANNALAYLASRDRATRASAVATAIGTGTTAAKAILARLAASGYAARKGSFWQLSDSGRTRLEAARKQVRAMVREQTLTYLTEHAPWNGAAKRPRTISAALGLDEGAVRAALDTLSQQGNVAKRGQAWRMAEPANQGRITAAASKKKVAACTAVAPPPEDTSEKRCRRCGTVKARTAFYNQKRTKDGLTHWCKACHADYSRKHAKAPQASITATKVGKRKPTKPAKGERTDTAQRKLIGQLIELLSDLKKTSGEAS